MSSFEGIDVISIADFSKEDVMRVLKTAKGMVPVATGRKSDNSLEGKIMSALFFEPSTRTRLSFESAMKRLGGGVLGFAQPEGTSIMKGETLADTVRMVDAYSDVVVIRHPHEGAARLAADFASKPVINAGDGAGQHPTQTLLDLYTIWEGLGKLDGVNIALVGDLKYGRTVHSLTTALTMFRANLSFVAPPSLQMPRELIDQVKEKGLPLKMTHDIRDIINDVDVLYVTRIQKERFPDPQEYAKVAGTYRIDIPLLRDVKKNLMIMHPLPRVDEIAAEVDETPYARYFQQALNGVSVRMALLSLIMGGTK